MSDRETVLARIRQALADRPEVDVPPVPEVWPKTNPEKPAMLARWAEELAEVAGEFHRCGSVDDARAKLAELTRELECARLGAVDQPLVRELVDGFSAAEVCWVDDATDKTTIGQLKASLVGSDLLLADTGSCLVECRTAPERMMCYLPPVCVVVAQADALREHMPAAWGEVVARVADPELRGELVIITGPSRTADIEKILILGVHGPKRLVVLVID